MFKTNHKDTRTTYQNDVSGVVLVFLLLILNIFYFLF